MSKISAPIDCAPSLNGVDCIDLSSSDFTTDFHRLDQFSRLTKLRIQHRAARLARVFRLDRHVRDDVSQQLWLRAIQAADRYEPGRGASLDHFVRLHLDYEYRTLRSELLAERAYGAVPQDGPSPHWPSHSPDHRPSSDLRLDLDAAEQCLLPQLRAVALKLRILTPAQIAAERGVHRGTVYREIALLRAALEDFFTGDEVPRDKATRPPERSCGTGRARRPSPGARPMPDPPAPPCPVSASRADRGRP